MSDGPLDEVEYEDGDANRVEGGMSKRVLEYVARQIVDDPDSVVVEQEPDRGGRGVSLRLHVAPDDMGKVIGKRGRVAQALRTVVRAAGAREGVEAAVDIVD
jgi:predicted RNA-binding protein YlqC (UPF0109 family)